MCMSHMICPCQIQNVASVCVCACATGRVSVSGNDAHIVDQHSFSRTGFDHHGCIMMGSVLNDRANDVALW